MEDAFSVPFILSCVASILLIRERFRILITFTVVSFKFKISQNFSSKMLMVRYTCTFKDVPLIAQR